MIVKIESLDHNGRGITRVNNKITFVSNSLPNEIVDINIVKEKKNYNEGICLKVIEESEDRKIPECPYYSKCGGCDIMHIDYEKQLEFKKDKVKNILKKYANLEVNPRIVASNKYLNYRNKITIHESNGKVGYMKSKTNEIIEIDYCPLAKEEINNYIKENKDKFKNELIIRSNDKGEIISNIDNKPMTIEINDLLFQIDINSFFQVNNYITSCIFNHIESYLEKSDVTLDLYSGVGTLSLVASKKSGKVYSIELNEYSHKNAIINAKLNNITNVKFMNGKVEDKIEEIKEKVDTIITDPPRSGMDSKTIEVIKKLNPKKIIYMSCDPMTFARDLNILNDSYNLEDITLFDMFPNTKHVESICILNKNN